MKAEWFSKKWKDAVWSKVIANFLWEYVRPWIVPIVAGAGASIWNSVDRDGFLSFIRYPISFPLWVGLLAILIVWLIIRLIKYLRKKRAVPKRNPILDEIVGTQTFESLYAKLSNERLQVRTERMQSRKVAPPDETLLFQLLEKRKDFSAGLAEGIGNNYDDAGYSTDVLAPKLEKYGLLEKKRVSYNRSGVIVILPTYYLTPAGYKFFDCWERFSPNLFQQLIYRSL